MNGYIPAYALQAGDLAEAAIERQVKAQAVVQANKEAPAG
jgi:hypothetical protein